MSNYNSSRVTILVVSPSPYIRGILKFVLETQLLADVTELESEEKSLSFLKNLTNFPSMIVYDYSSNAFLLEDFVAYLKDNSKFVRIAVLVNEVRDEGREILKDIQQLKLMQESGLPNNLIEEAQTLFGDSPYVNESQYCKIDIDFLSILDGINKNLYIKLGQDKYIKIFNEDDNTNILDIKKYKEKGIQYLYVKRDTALWVINHIQKQMDIFLRSNNFKFVLRGASDTPEKRFEQKILRIDEEVHIDAEFKHTIDKTIESIKAIVEKEKKIEPLLEALKQNQSNHALFTQKIKLTSIISCILAKELAWISKATMDKLVYASVLCDITLAVRPELLKIQTLAEFESIKHTLSEEDQKIFLSHPKDGANLIKGYFNAPPDTHTLAYQHHELPDGSGFPLALKGEKISPLSALYIVANDFAYYFLLDDEPHMEDFILKCNSRYDFVNFRKVLKALERLRKK